MNNQNTANVKMKAGQGIIVTIKRLGINGEGIGYYKRKVVFVAGALPEEVVIAEVTNVERNLTYAKLKAVKEPSPHRIRPFCAIYDECGGCQLQHLLYSEQLKGKQDIVRESFERYYQSEQQPEILETIGMEKPWYYRNKAQFRVGRKDEKLAIGMYKEGTRDIVDITNCPVQHPATTEVIKNVRSVLENHKAIVRTLVARVGVNSGETQLTMISRSDKLENEKQLTTDIRTKLPKLKSLMHNAQPDGRDPSVFGADTRKLSGQDYIEEAVGDVQLRISARAFFQLNTEQMVKMYDLIKVRAALTGKEKVIDAYCGTGTIALWIADGAAEVRGMDIIPEAIADANANLELNSLSRPELKTKLSFHQGRAEELLPEWAKQGFKPDVVIVDPPRTGCDRELLQTLLRIKPKKIIYASCNPATLAKDCNQLKGTYNISSVQPLDMFPQTAQVECVCLLTKK